MEDLATNLPDLNLGDTPDLQADLPDLQIDTTGGDVSSLPDLNIDFNHNATKPTAELVGKAATDPDSFSSDVGRAVDNMQASLGGFVQTVGELSRADGLANWGSKFAKEQQAQAAAYGTPSVSGISDIKSLEDLADWGKNLAANTIAYMGIPIAVGGSALAAGASIPAATIGVFLASLPLSIGETENLIKELNPEAENPLSALAAGTAEAGLNAFGLGKILAPVAKRIGIDALVSELEKQGVEKSLAAQWLQNTVTMGVIGSSSYAIENLTAHNAAGVELNGREFIDGLLDAGISNSVVGGVLGGLGKLSEKAAYNEAAPSPKSLKAVEKQVIKQENAPDVSKIDKYGTDKLMYLAQGRVLDPIEPLKVNSPSFAKAFDLIRKDRETPLKVTETPPVHDRYKLIDATFSDMFHQARRDSGLSEEAFWSKYVTGDRTTHELQLMGLVGDTIRKKSTSEGIGGGWIDNFVPHTWDKAKILNNREQFIKDVSPYASGEEIHSLFLHLDEEKTPNEVAPIKRLFDGSDTTDQIASRFLDKNGEVKRKLLSPTVPRKVGHLEFARMLPDVPQAIASKWNEGGFKGMDQKYADYIHQASKRIAFAEAFGADGHKLNTLIVKGIAENNQKGRAVLKQEIDHLYDSVDAFNGQYGKLSGKEEHSVIAGLKAGAITTSLTLSQLSSLVDPMNLMVKAGVVNTMKGMFPAVYETTREMAYHMFKNVPRTELASTMAAAGLTIESAKHTMLARAGDYSAGRLANEYVKGYFALNPVTYWTHFTRIWGAEVGKSIINDDLQIVKYLPANSEKGLAARLRLASNEINPDTYWNATLENRNAMMARGVRSFVSETALEPNFSDKPLWMSKQGWTSLLGVAKSYPIMFSNTVLPSLLKKLTPGQWGELERLKGSGAVQSALSGTFILGSFLTIGALQDHLRQMVKQGTFDYEDERTDDQKMLEIFDRTIEPMWASYITSAYSSVKYGSDPVSAVGGPGVSFVNRMVKDARTTINSMTYELSGVELSENASDKSSIDALTKWLIDATPLVSFKQQLIEQ